MFWHAVTPVLLVSRIVTLGTWFGSIHWAGMQVYLTWYERSGVFGDVSSNIVYLPAPIFVGILAVSVIALTMASRFLLAGVMIGVTSSRR